MRRDFNPDRSSPISWMAVIVRNTAIDAASSSRRFRPPTSTSLCWYRNQCRMALTNTITTMPGHRRDRDPPAPGGPPDAAVACLYRRRKPAIAGGSVLAYRSAPSRPGCGERLRRCAPIARRSRLRRRTDRAKHRPNWGGRRRNSRRHKPDPGRIRDKDPADPVIGPLPCDEGEDRDEKHQNDG